MNILVIEDDSETAAFIANALTREGNTVHWSADGRSGLSLAETASYDVTIVDRMLPGLDGLSVVTEMRARRNPSAILFLTNLGGIDDRVEGLDAGGDDYLVKPFAVAELVARVNALARRSSTAETVLRVGDLELDLIKRSVARNGLAIDLQPREFKLLEFLMRHADRVVTRTMLLEKVWNFHFDPKTNIVETHVSRLRAKVDRGFDREMIHTLRGSGYSLRAPS